MTDKATDVTEYEAHPEKPYVRNCYIEGRDGEDVPLFTKGWVAHLDGYAIIPKEKYEALLNEQGHARTASEQPASSEVIEASAWIVGDSSGTRWRTWNALGPDWTEDREKATRYARREDAEQVHEADEEAWRVQIYIAASDAGRESGASMLSGCMEFSEKPPVAALSTTSEAPAQSGEGRSNGAGEDALDRLAVRVLHDYRKRDGLTCYNYDHNRLRDERYMRETFAELVAPFLAALAAPQGEMERLRRAALTDDPDWICAGVPDHAIEAGIEAWKAAESDMELRARCENPEDVTDWDEGMIVAAIFKAIGTALAKVKGAPDAR